MTAAPSIAGAAGVSAPAAATTAARIGPGVAAAWGAFCLLMLLVGLQERWYADQPLWPWPLFYEASSMAVATLVAVWRWRRGPRDDPWLNRPARWFWRVLRWTPLVALLFVAALYGLRHAVRALFGLDYLHQPWPQVLAYEGAKFAVFYTLFAGVQFALHSFRALAAAQLRSEQLQRLHSQSRLALLTQQMQPHFLFNALNTVAALVHDAPDAADAALLRLAALLRAATEAAQRPLQPLADELALAHDYAALMQQRFGEQRLRLSWAVEEGIDTQVPTLSLQPLLENAFVHAVERRAGLTTVSITVVRAGSHLQLTVSDDGPGPDSAAAGGSGVALANLRERLQALHGDAATLAVVARPQGGTQARMELPLHG